MAKVSPPTELAAFLASIGSVCLQWALLEQTLLLLIATAENMPLEKAYTRYGTTDMMPRVRMAIRLTEEANWPQPLQRRIKAIRTALQKEGGKGLAERRNLFVHGAHKHYYDNGEVELTMVRWARNDRAQVVTIADSAQLANRLSQLAEEAFAIFSAYCVGKDGTGDVVNRDQYIAEAKAQARLIRAYNIKRALKLLWANLKPW